jgi:hypothetical protein
MLKLKSLRLSLLSLIFIALFACKSDDEVAPEEQDPIEALEFDAQNPPIELPSAMQNSSNQYAATVNGFAASVNALTTYNGYFQVPEGAEYSTTPITGVNERTAASFRVYTWTASDGVNSLTYAYQLSEDNDDYVFEIFYKYNSDNYYKLLEGRESKGDLRVGSLSWYGLEENSGVIYSYTWEESSDGSFSMVWDALGQRVTFDIAADGSGLVEVYYDNVIATKITWNAAGTEGTYITYSDGVAVETINWTS